MRRPARFTSWLTPFVLLAACNSTPPSPSSPAEPSPSLLEIAAPEGRELVFSSATGETSDVQTLTLKNVGTSPLELTTLGVSGTDAATFALDAPPTLPLTLPAGESFAVGVRFIPAASGVSSGSLEVAGPTVSLAAGLYGLGSSGEMGDDEPTLQQIVETLGYEVGIGSDDFELGSTAEPVGKEVLEPMFERAADGPVTLEIVARYGSDAALPFGYFTLNGAEPVQHEVASVGKDTAQELFPPLASGETTFDPGTQAFGLYAAKGRYSLDPLNRSGLSHAFRVYPLSDRSGQAVPNSYLLALEEGSEGAYQDALFVLRNVKPSTAALPDTHTLEGWRSLFNGQNLSGWYTYVPGQGKNSDPERIFKVEDGTLHILDVANRGYRDFSYMATYERFSNYELRLEYQWGNKRFEPRESLPRDSGVIYHFGGQDEIWPTGIEFQIQEGDTGDFWMLDGTRIKTTVDNPNAAEPAYKPGGRSFTSRPGEFVRVANSGTYDTRTGWNTVNIVVQGSSAVHSVNGRVNNRAQHIMSPGGGPLSSGRILLQAEGAEIYYRNIEIRSLD